MRLTAIFFLFLLVCLALAAVFTVPLMQTGWLNYPPERVMGRLAQIFVLLGFWPFLKTMGLADPSSLGFGPARRPFLAAVGLGWILGVLMLSALVLALIGLGVRVPDPGALVPGALVPGPLAEKLLAALIGGFLVAVLEEIFFRGALFTAIRRRDGLKAAAVWSAVLYAALHVMKPGALPAGASFDVSGALTMVSGVFLDVFQWRHLDTLAALFAVGIFLALVRERTGHIGWCIGLHAGWVLVIQATRRVSDGNPQAPLAFLAGDYDGVIGWLAVVWIGAVGWVYWRTSAPGAAAGGAATADALAPRPDFKASRHAANDGCPPGGGG